MNPATTTEEAQDDNDTRVERTSDREIVVTRIVNGPADLVFDAWTQAELFQRWWVPKSLPMTLVGCEIDARVGGGYKLTFDFDGSTMDFHGRYLEVDRPTRLVWTNEEGDGEATVTTVTFEETDDGRTRIVYRDRYPSAEALEEGAGSTDAMPEALAQLDDLLAALGEAA